jgi:hypothetical protein
MREVRIAQGVTVSIASGPSTESGRRTLIVVVDNEDGQPRTEMMASMADAISQTDHVFKPTPIGQQIEIETDLREDSAVHALVETIFRVIIDWRQTLTDSQRRRFRVTSAAIVA